MESRVNETIENADSGKIGNSFLWVEKYKPNKVSELIVPQTIKNRLSGYVKNRNMPNLIFAGSAGVSKTVSARALVKELGYDFMMVNASLDNGIDTLRNQIQSFCTSVSFNGDLKALILDEADFLNPTSTQPALRGFIEKFTSTRFIMTCNFPNRILDPIKSRCTVINFEIPPEERETLLKETAKRVFYILKNEGVAFDKKLVMGIIIKNFPDLRKTLNYLQALATNKVIDETVVDSLQKASTNYEELMGILKVKNFTEMRKWVAMNRETVADKIFTWMYHNAHKFMVESSLPQLVLTTAEYQYKQAFAIDREINVSAYLTEVMANCEFK